MGKCSKCGTEVDKSYDECPGCGVTFKHATEKRPTTNHGEPILLRARPKMKGRPLLFALCLLLVPAAGIGLAFLLGWGVYTMSHELVITDTRARKRTGFLSKKLDEVRHADVRNVQIKQGVLQSMTGCGTVRLATAGHAGIEISIHSVEDPEGIRDLIYNLQEEES